MGENKTEGISPVAINITEGDLDTLIVLADAIIFPEVVYDPDPLVMANAAIDVVRHRATEMKEMLRLLLRGPS